MSFQISSQYLRYPIEKRMVLFSLLFFIKFNCFSQNLFSELADSGDIDAMFEVGHEYYHGEDKNLELGYYYLKCASDLGHTGSFFHFFHKKAKEIQEF